MKTLLLTTGLTLGVAGAALAQPTFDGSIVGDELFYGSALSTQNTQTQFGDATGADPALTFTGGSEINQVFAVNDGTNLNVLITGNLESNFNKLEIFFDSVSGGVNTINGANLPQGVDGNCCGLTDPNDASTLGDGALQRQDGLTFDTGFNADYYLTITNGIENVNVRDAGAGIVDPDEPAQSFWAVSAHYADLTNGPSGAAGPLGYQTAPRGLPQVLRNPHDVNRDGVVNAADYTSIRDGLADPNGDGVSDALDVTNWQTNFATDSSLAGPEFLPSADFNSSAQLGGASVALPGLSQGELIDRDYALGAGGCLDDEGNGCVAEELEFALDVAPDEADNGSDHRLFNNTIDLRLALDNSNELGVDAGTGTPTDASTATTGIEFSIPLAALGDPTGDIKIFAGINGTGHDFYANQFAGEGVLAGNLGTTVFSSDPFPFTFNDFAGDQFVTVPAVTPSSTSVPEPSAAVLLAVASGMGLLARRRG